MIYKEMIHLEYQKNKVFHCGKHNLVLFNFNVDHDVMFPNIWKWVLIALTVQILTIDRVLN